jgi:hypothetical protein
MNIDFKKKSTFMNVILTLVLVTFIVLELIICPHHEHCADETQAWLLARDASFLDIVTKWVRYECTPALWHIILKIFMFLKLPYSLFYIIPIIFSSIGVGLFLFKSKFPIWVKVLFPFTYYIFYQFTIVARSYCLILPFLTGLAIIYPKKLEKPFLFTLLLVLFANISSHCFIITLSIFLLYLMDLFKKLKAKEVSTILLKQNIVSIIIICSSLILTFFTILPPNDFTFSAPIHFDIIGVEIGLNMLGNVLILNTNNAILDVLGVILLIIFVFSFYKKSFKILEFLIIISPVAFFLSFFYWADQHLGIVFLLIIFAFWIHFDENKLSFKQNKLFYILFLVILIVQIKWTINSVKYDLKYDYSGADKVAKFIKEKSKAGSEVYGFGYETTGIQPFFNKNIFYNHQHDKTFFIWSKLIKLYNKEDMVKCKNADITVISINMLDSKPVTIDKNMYDGHVINGGIYTKNKVSHDESFIIIHKLK